MKIIGNDIPGLFQRVLVELGRRNIDVEKSFMARGDGLITIIVETNTGSINGRLLHAITSLQDVNSAEYLNEDYFCFWESCPEKGSDFLLACGADKHAGVMKKAAEHCLYRSTNSQS
ncbi:MAG: hypothetical protein GX369_00280 [Euryarchaeota archaeon]|nr:hypothetical protein [Euryarchaeota archaeon]